MNVTSDLTLKNVTPEQIAAVFAALYGNTGTSTPAIVAATAPGGTTATAVSGDDENSDADAPAGALDKNGLPHDDRIHSTPAKLTTKGVWRAKRGVDDAAFIASVENELRARVAASANATTAQPQPTPVPVQQPVPVQTLETTTIPQQPVAVQPVPVQQSQPTPVPVQQPVAVQPVQVQQPQPGAYDYASFMQRIGQLVNMAGADGLALVTPDYLGSVVDRVNSGYQKQFAAITDLGEHQAYVDYAIQLMFADGRWQ